MDLKLEAALISRLDLNPVEAGQALEAIGQGAVDAFAIADHGTYRIARLQDGDADLARPIIENSTACFLLLDADGCCRYINRAGEQLLGWTADELRGTLLHARIHQHPDSPASIVNCPLARELAGGGAMRTREEMLVGRSGERMAVLITANPLIRDGQSLGTIVEIRDDRERKSATEELQLHQARLQLAMAAGGLGVHDYDVERDCAVWTPELYEIVGLDPRSVSRLADITSLIHPDDRARVSQAMTAALDPGGTGTFVEEFRLCRADTSEVRWVANRSQTTFAGDGPARRAVRSVGVLTDITERTRREANVQFLNEASALLTAASDARGAARQVLEMLAGHLHVGLAALGAWADDGAPVRSVVGHGDAHHLPAVIEGLSEVLRGGGGDELREGRAFAIDDLARDFHMAAPRALFPGLDAGAVIAVPFATRNRSTGLLIACSASVRTWSGDEIQLLRDLGTRLWPSLERADAEAELRESEARFRMMADQTPVVMWVHDVQGGLEFANRAYCEFFGVSLSEVYGPNWMPLVHPEDGAYVEAFTAALRDGTEFRADTRVRRADGEWRWVRSHGMPRYDAHGRVIGQIGVTRDITDQLLAATAERTAAREKDEFIAVLAHELRNPLAPIRTAMSLLRVHGSQEPRNIRYREVVERQVTQMARLLDDLLDVSRLSQGKLSLQRCPTALHDVITASVEMASPAVDDRRHTLTVEDIDPSIVVNADAVRLTQVFGNLLNNAAKYTDAGGRIAVSAVRHEDRVTVGVRDTGVGIEPDFALRVFDLFAQAGDANARSQGGLGIGLSLAKRLVEMHGGTIAVESAGRGQGSEFFVTLPVAGNAAPSSTPSERPWPEPLRRTVLVADDNVDNADMMAALLESLGCDVRVVYDGAAALADAESFRPDIIFLDLGMPGTSGQAVCEHIRQQPWGATPRIIAVTGWGQEEDRRRTREAGFDVHLVKPVDTDLLTRLVRDVPPVSFAGDN